MLDKELEMLKPRILIALGNESYKNLINLYGECDYKIIKVYHPAYFIRNNRDVNEYYEHVKEKVIQNA